MMRKQKKTVWTPPRNENTLRRYKLSSAFAKQILLGLLLTMPCTAVMATEYEDVGMVSNVIGSLKSEYNFKEDGSYDDQLIWISTGEGYNVNVNNVVVNIENNGNLSIKFYFAPIDISCGDDDLNTKENDKILNTTINGNLYLTFQTGSNDGRAIDLFTSGSTLTFNGKVNIVDTLFSSKSTNSAYGEAIRSIGSAMKFNDAVNINNFNVNYLEKNDSLQTTLVFAQDYGQTPALDHETSIDFAKDINVDNVSITSHSSGVQEFYAFHSSGDKSIINVNGAATVQNVSVNNDNGATQAFVICASDGGTVNINGDLSINKLNVQRYDGKEYYINSLNAYESGTININANRNENIVADITGDIEASDNAVININLLNSKSKLIGASIIQPSGFGEGIINMQLANGANWYIKDRYKSGNEAYDADMKNCYVTSLTGKGGNIHMDIDASTNADDNRLFIGTHEGEHYLYLNNIDTSNSYNATGKVLVSVKDETGRFIVPQTEGGLYWKKYELGMQDSATEGYTKDWYLKGAENIGVDDKPTTSVDTVLSVNSLNYHTWRENDKLLNRMHELRTNGADENGAWFRVYGSEIGRNGDFGFENKYTTYQLGYDTAVKRTDDVTRYQGIALSYTDGSSSYDKGSGDNHSKEIGFYSTSVYNTGHYLDLTLKLSNLDNDFKVFDSTGKEINGEFDNNGISVSAEYGRKNMLKHGWYIEPQAQFTLGYLDGADYNTSNGISVKQSGITSAVGRVGFNIGKNVGENGVVYAKANLLHEFGGDYDVDMRCGSDKLTYSDTFDDTWFEYGVGAAFMTGKNSYIYFDVERSAGSDFYKDWKWNAGVRLSF